MSYEDEYEEYEEDEYEEYEYEEEDTFVKSLPPHLKFVDYIYVTADWEWTVVVILQDTDGMFYIGTDSGCSCNGPLDYGTVYSEEDYTGPLTFKQVIESVALSAADGLFEVAVPEFLARDLFSVAVATGLVNEPKNSHERSVGEEAICNVLKSVMDEARQNEEEEEEEDY